MIPVNVPENGRIDMALIYAHGKDWNKLAVQDYASRVRDDLTAAFDATDFSSATTNTLKQRVKFNSPSRTNCKNCGAALHRSDCEYCGSRY